MAKTSLKDVSKGEPETALGVAEQEEVYSLIRRGLAVALLLNESATGDGEHAPYAAGAIVDAIHAARGIMEKGGISHG